HQSSTSPQVHQRKHHSELVQDDLTLTRRVGQTVSFSCGRTDQCDQYVVWLQKKETETFKLILRITTSSGYIYKGYNHPQKDDFSSVNYGNGWELEIKKVKVDHSASYYCFCYKSGSHSKNQLSLSSVGKSSLLCVASDMFPPLVQFSWKIQKKKEDGSWDESSPAEGEQLELRESGRSASILLLHQPQNSTYKYRCEVKHEGGTVEAQTQQGDEVDK
uniref:Ig-like domain-containing protein n=1 Tax=Anabas testudineus TaxID=64144 RepID=A0A3Q1HY67_ANATE